MGDATRADATPIDLAELCALEAASGRATSAQAVRVQHHVDSFAASLKALSVVDAASISASLCESFISSPRSTGEPASVRLMRERRTALRFAFRLARRDGLIVHDPCVDLDLPPRPENPVRPLRDAEVLACRSSSLWDLSDSRRAAAWALAEATARSSELPHLRVSDLDLDVARVWIHGGKTTTARWGYFTDWGLTQITRRVEHLAGDETRGLVYEGRSPKVAGQVATCTAVIDVLRRAGLTREPQVRPASVAAWAGRRILTETSRIDVVATRLGLSSLDRTARFVRWEWGEESPR